MTRKHFKALAAAIAKVEDYSIRALMCDVVGGACEQFNSSFSWSIWRNSCRVATN